MSRTGWLRYGLLKAWAAGRSTVTVLVSLLMSYVTISLAVYIIGIAKDEETPSNQSTPRSKRGYIHRTESWLKSTLTSCNNYLQNEVLSWDTTRVDRLRIEKARRIAEDLSGLSRSKRGRNGFWKTLTVMTILTMQMKSGNFTNQVTFDTDSGTVGIDN
jgi:hypothetical protein